ncbi:hypothetical protein SBRCBS47491_002624 [Sporothrix bragantina]|uniref:CN hydrolase domain-containing protein n=1 Tax=Sporothrix bragantina TaxID=671064 RepID=A0ABP0B8N4_9PEZI
MTKIRLGTCSPAAADSPQASLAVLEKFASQAAAQGIDLLLLPEAFLGGGYPRGMDFGSILGADKSAGRDAFLHYFQRAVDFGDVVGDAGAGGGDAWINKDIQGSSAGDGSRETLEQIARDTGVFLVVGAIEKAGGSLYCAVVYVCPKQGVLGKRRKVQPVCSTLIHPNFGINNLYAKCILTYKPPKTGLERLIWSTAGPASLRAVSTEIKGVRINLAAAICWENYMPLVRQSLYTQNVNLYLAPTADGSDAWLSLVRTIGIEGRCFVVTSNMSTTASGSAALESAAAATDQTPTYTTPQWQSSQQNDGPSSAATAAGGTASRANGAGITTKIVDCAPACAGGKPRRRKKSFVLDEYGNEIVLSCETVVEEDVDTANGIMNGTTNATTNGTSGVSSDAPVPLPPFPRLPVDQAWERHKHERRRSSVFDEDDNEIVLCRPQDATGTTSDQPFEDSASEKSTGTGPGLLDKAPAGSNMSQKMQAPASAAQDSGARGGSAIVSPFGDVLAGPQWDDANGIIVADVDFEDCIRGRLDLDVAGHYSRYVFQWKPIIDPRLTTLFHLQE